MPHQRLARVSEINEEGSDKETGDVQNNTPSSMSPSNSSPSLKLPAKNCMSRRSSNTLHVTINTKPEDMDCDGNSSVHSNASSRRPSGMIQEILSSRRPSAIMAALRSPKQFVNNRFRREYVNFIYFKNFFEFLVIFLFSIQVISRKYATWAYQWARLVIDEEKSTFWRVGIEIVNYTNHSALFSFFKFNTIALFSLFKWCTELIIISILCKNCDYRWNCCARHRNINITNPIVGVSIILCVLVCGQHTICDFRLHSTYANSCRLFTH